MALYINGVVDGVAGVSQDLFPRSRVFTSGTTPVRRHTLIPLPHSGGPFVVSPTTILSPAPKGVSIGALELHPQWLQPSQIQWVEDRHLETAVHGVRREMLTGERCVWADAPPPPSSLVIPKGDERTDSHFR